MENDILSFIKAIAEDGIPSPPSFEEANKNEDEGVPKKRKRSMVSEYNFNHHVLNNAESMIEINKLKQIIENQQKTIKQQAFNIKQIAQNKRNKIAANVSGNEKPDAVTSVQRGLASKVDNKSSRNDGVKLQQNASAAKDDGTKNIENKLERITAAASWMHSEIIYLEELYRNEKKEKERWKKTAIKLLKQAKEHQRKEDSEIVHSTEQPTVCVDHDERPTVSTDHNDQPTVCVAQEQQAPMVQLDEIYDGEALNCSLLTSDSVLLIDKIAAAEKGYWNVYFKSKSTEFLKIPLETLFDRYDLMLHLCGKFVCNNKNKRRIEEISHRIRHCSLTDLQLNNQTIQFDDFQKLFSSKTIKNVFMKNVTVMGEFEEVLEIDEILKELPLVETFEYWFKFYNEVTPETSKLLLHFERFRNLQVFKLCNVSRMFDLNSFAVFIQRHENVKFILEYRWQQESAQNGIRQMAQALTIPSSCSLTIQFAER